MTEDMTTFTPAAYPMYGEFQDARGHTFRLLIAGYRTDGQSGITEPMFILSSDIDEDHYAGDIYDREDIPGGLLEHVRVFPMPVTVEGVDE